MDKQATLKQAYEHGFQDELEKMAAQSCSTPGMKIRSKGKGRGMARGGGKGPVGVPVGEKDKWWRELAESNEEETKDE